VTEWGRGLHFMRGWNKHGFGEGGYR